jgi:hypothetical protein
VRRDGDIGVGHGLVNGILQLYSLATPVQNICINIITSVMWSFCGGAQLWCVGVDVWCHKTIHSTIGSDFLSV